MVFPYLSEDRIDRAARALLFDAFQTHDAAYPVDLDVIIYDCLCERDELHFNDEADFDDAGSCDDVLGKTLPSTGRILINRGLKARGEEGRYRFTVAHELGHWILHRPVVLAAAAQAGLFDNGEQYEFVSLNRDVFPRADRRAVAREEWQANRFAVALLIGKDRLREEFLERFGLPPVARVGRDGLVRSESIRSLASELASAQVNALPRLREIFGLSAEAMAIALEVRGYVADSAPMM